MIRFAAQRLGLGLVILWAVATLVFLSALLLPGDAAQSILGNTATPDQVAFLRREMGLEMPAVTRYFSWLGDVVTGDLGRSITSGEPVAGYLGSSIANSAVLVAITALIAFPISIYIGVWASWRAESSIDHFATIMTLVLAALPEFVIAFILLFCFSTGLFGWLPATATGYEGAPLGDKVQQLVLPVLTLVLVLLAYGIRMTRGTMLEVLATDYVQQARLNGMNERRVLIRHALRNAVGPVTQVLALQLAWLMGGVVIVEYVFNYPGVGKGIVDAVAQRDVPTVQGFTLAIAAVYVLVNFLADAILLSTTPKARQEVSSSS